MNSATCKQVGDSSLLRGYKRCSMKCRCVEMFSLVVMSQLHLFENEVTIFFFGKSKSTVASQSSLPLFLVMPIGVVECDASSFYIE